VEAADPPWTHKEIAYGITSLPADLAGPATWLHLNGHQEHSAT
jgi:hypothetical protein